MTKVLLTLLIDKEPSFYHIRYGKERKRFTFQPGPGNLDAPTFVVLFRQGQWRIAGDISEGVAAQAITKVRQLLQEEEGV